MGCAASRIGKDERVQVCKERKKLMKRLLVFRGDFTDSQLSYLRALKNTGVTLRQFTESDSLELENTSYAITLPPSPPLTLPPPPPLPFSADLRKQDGSKKESSEDEDSIEMDGHAGRATPPPPMQTTWGFWDPFDYSSSLPPATEANGVEEVEEENWAETRSEFEDEEDEEEIVSHVDVKNVKTGKQKVELREQVDDNSSTTSWYMKGSEEMPIIECRKKKTLEHIVRELDDYFLKASACEKEIAVFMDISMMGDTAIPLNDSKRRRSNSAKVFSALSWSWSSKSLQFPRDSTEFSSTEPCKPGANCITLEKIYEAERKLYKDLKEEETTKIELAKKTTLLQKQEEENQDWSKTEKTRLCVDNLESDMRRLQDSISTGCSTIQKLIDQELYPQLVTLTSGLAHMWTAMYKCHQVQSQISQQLNHLTDCEKMDLSSEFRRQAAAQLESEVACWYSSFCKLVKSQQDYARVLCRWIQFTSGLVGDQQQSGCSVAARKLCEEWNLMSKKLPDKAAAEAIQNFLSAIHSIMLQQAEEHNLHKKWEKLEKRLQKESLSLVEMEQKFKGDLDGDDAANYNPGPKHPLSLKRAKIEALKESVDAEKAKYNNSVQHSKTMTLKNLRTRLPDIFQSLIEFSRASAQAFEAIHSHFTQDVCSTSQGETSKGETSQNSEMVQISETCEGRL